MNTLLDFKKNLYFCGLPKNGKEYKKLFDIDE